MSRSLFLVLFLLSLIWGSSFYFIKILLQDFGPWTIAFLRSSFGLATIVAIMLLFRKPFAIRTIPWLPMTVMALVNTAIPWAIIGFSETRLTSGMASVLNATTPLWTVVVGMFFFQAITNRLQWLGLGIGITGLIILLGVNSSTIINVDLLGFICMIAASLCYAIGSQLSKRLLKGLTMYQITFGTLLCAMLGSGMAAFSLEPISLPHLSSPSNLAAVTGLGVFGSGIAYILFYYIVQKGSPEFATMVTYLLPASAMIWGYTLLNEDIHWRLLLGLAFILSGVFLAGRKDSGKRLRPIRSRETISRAQPIPEERR
ncbi:DMT family transporter [Paenibacillus harenae]|uniref:DMT family transporter n=1 Tax=Paenibacillus harenae TaxID=306543 RepID=UPI00040F7A25|nr:EamA family transporter [Paenibacillus harenae]